MKDYLLRLIDKKEAAEGTMSFSFDTTGTDYAFKAGQFADFTLLDPPETDAEGNTRTFSLSSSPNETKRITITTRLRETAFKRTLKKAELGTKVKVTAAMGSFTLHANPEKPAVFIVGGIGVTPAHSMIAYATEEHLPHMIYLFHANRTPASTPFRADFESYKRLNKHFTYVPTITESDDKNWPYEHGQFDEGMMRKYLKDPKVLAEAIAYVSGPPAMVSDLALKLPKMGFNADNVRTEEFAGY